jgi:HEAT repeat protein
MIRLGAGSFTLIKVNYDYLGQRDVIIARLRAALPEKNLVTVSLRKLDPRLPKSAVELCDGLEELARRNADGKTVDAVLLVDWEQRLSQDRPPQQQPSDTLTELFNFGREALKERFHCPFIVFLPRWAASIVYCLAPDLMSGRSGSFYFASENIRVAPSSESVESTSAEWWDIFRGAAALTPEDRIVGRERDLEKFLGMVLAPNFRCGTLWGETGCGKTSFVQAGLLPELKRAGHFVVYLNEYRSPITTLKSALTGVFPDISESTGSLYEALTSAPQAETRQITFLLFDQFERVYAETVLSPETRRTFLNDLACCINDNRLPIRCIFLPRADYLHHLLRDFDHLTPLNHPLTVNYRYELPWLSQADAERVLDVLGKRADKHWQQELIQEVIKDLSRNNQVKPVEIQLIGATLFLFKIESIDDYKRASGKHGLLRNYLNAIFDDISNSMLARCTVRTLVLASDPPLRTLPKSAQQVAAELRKSLSKVETVLEELEKRHIVRLRKDEPEAAYELIHDTLIEPALKSTDRQEIGQAIIYSALRNRRWFLWLPSYWRARRVDLNELTPVQRIQGQWLLRRSVAAMLAGGICALVVGVVTVVQFVMIHVNIDDSIPTQPVKFYRGLSAFSFLPGPLGAVPQFGTGIMFKFDLSPESLSAIRGLNINRWADPISQARLLIPYLSTKRELMWRSYFLGDWKESLKQALLLDKADIRNQPLIFYMVHSYPEAAIGPLIELAERDNNLAIRANALVTLGNLQAPTGQEEMVVKTLLFAALDRNEEIRKAASDAFQALHRLKVPAGQLTVPIGQEEVVVKTLLAAAAQERNKGVRGVAVSALGVLGQLTVPAGQEEVVVKTLLAAAQDQNVEVRLAAVGALERLTVPAWQEEVVVKTLLAAAAQDQNEQVRYAARYALGQLMVPAGREEVIVKTLLAAAQDQNEEVQGAAVFALAGLTVRVTVPAWQEEVVVKTLLAAAQDQNMEVRLAAVGALGRLTAPAGQREVVVKTLLAAAQDQNEKVRPAAVDALGRLTVPAGQEEVVVKTLLSVVQDQNEDILRESAINALGRLTVPAGQEEAVVKTLLAAAQDPKEAATVQIAATVALLGRLTLPAEQEEMVVKTLFTMPYLPSVAAALERLSVPAERKMMIVKTLLTRVQDQSKSKYFRDSAVIALGRLTVPAGQEEAVVKTLLAAAQDQNEEVWDSAVIALERLTVPAGQEEVVVKTLLSAMQVGNNEVAYSAYKALMGVTIVPTKQVASIVSVLVPFTNDADEGVRYLASCLLGRIKLASIQQDSSLRVYQALLQQLRTEETSRLNAGYRRALCAALAYWYNAGWDDAGNYPFARDPRARGEHADLQKALENLRDTGSLWLRHAAANVWVIAYSLRQYFDTR